MPVYANIHPHMRPYADIWLTPRRAAARLAALDTAFETERPHRLPRQFPKLLARAPDPAGGLGGVPQRHLVVVDTHADEVSRLAPRFPSARLPATLFNDEIDGLQAALFRRTVSASSTLPG